MSATMAARHFSGSKLVVATHNRGKAGEIGVMLAPFGVHVLSHGELGLAVPEETGTTFLENAVGAMFVEGTIIES